MQVPILIVYHVKKKLKIKYLLAICQDRAE